MTRFAKRRDKAERAIIDALREVGAHVSQVSDFGVPDLIVGYRGATYLLEVKEPLGARGGGSHGDLTPAQLKWWSEWPGGPANVVRSPEEALAAIGAHIVPFEQPEK